LRWLPNCFEKPHSQAGKLGCFFGPGVAGVPGHIRLDYRGFQERQDDAVHAFRIRKDGDNESCDQLSIYDS